jgi:hypothetical protein
MILRWVSDRRSSVWGTARAAQLLPLAVQQHLCADAVGRADADFSDRHTADFW